MFSDRVLVCVFPFPDCSRITVHTCSVLSWMVTSTTGGTWDYDTTWGQSHYHPSRDARVLVARPLTPRHMIRVAGELGGSVPWIVILLADAAWPSEAARPRRSDHPVLCQTSRVDRKSSLSMHFKLVCSISQIEFTSSHQAQGARIFLTLYTVGTS